MSRATTPQTLSILRVDKPEQNILPYGGVRVIALPPSSRGPPQDFSFPSFVR